ncbi:MAG: hypothetical protein AAF242_16500, partial [Bacteroidota bacterium]
VYFLTIFTRKDNNGAAFNLGSSGYAGGSKNASSAFLACCNVKRWDGGKHHKGFVKNRQYYLPFQELSEQMITKLMKLSKVSLLGYQKHILGLKCRFLAFIRKT